MSSYITETDILIATSSASIPFYQITLPVAEIIKAKFDYKYYTRDEGVSEEVSLDAVDAESDQYDFIMENWEEGVTPREVKLTLVTRDIYATELLAPGTITNALRDGKINFEDAPFSTRYSSIIVHDTSIDEKIYNIISGTSDKQTSLAKGILNVANLQSAGYRFSKAQTREQVTNLYETDIKDANLSISLNNLFINDIVKTSLAWQASAYSDEFLSVLPEAQTQQDEERTKALPNVLTISESEIDTEITSIFNIFSRVDPLKGATSRSSYTRKVGYIIEKYGEQLDGSNLKYPDIVIEDPQATSYVDSAVRYGATYSYKLRTVYKTLIITTNPDDAGLGTSYFISTVLIASTGKFTTVKCVETTPPLPPNNITFQQTLSGLYIRWNFPINPQKDIKRFQIFRRPNIDSPFSLIKELNFDTTILPYTTGETVPNERVVKFQGPIKHYLDSDFNDIDSDYIYALCAIDAHGYSSAFSEQFRVRFDKLTAKILITRISTEGAPKPYPNVNILGDFFSDVIKDSGHKRVRVYFDPEYKEITRNGTPLNLISASTAGKVTYQINMTEINLGQSQTINIVVNDALVTQNGIPISLARFYKSS